MKMIMSTPNRTSISDAKSVIPIREAESHKGDFGRLLTIGGGSSFVGAPVLVGLAALRSGVDLSIIAAPEKTAWNVNSLSPDLITIKLTCKDLEPSVVPDILEILERSNAVVVGPGLGLSPKTRDTIIELARALRKRYQKHPALFDADAIKALASERSLIHGMPWVITPHAGEFKILTGTELHTDLRERAEQVKVAAKKNGCVVLLKGQVDIIASATGDIKLNHTGNPGMTVGGTGDVLSGTVGTFLAQGAKPFEAAVTGAWICGRAGDLCLREKGYEFLASDVINKLPEVFMEVRRKG